MLSFRSQARKNLNAEYPYWDFDSIVKKSQNRMEWTFVQIEVKGGQHEEKVRFCIPICAFTPRKADSK